MCSSDLNNGPVTRDALSHDLADVGSSVDRIFVSGMFGAMKPAAQVYRGLESAMQVRPAELVLIDDSRANVDGARQAGWSGIHFQSASQLDDELRRLGVTGT